MGCKRVGSSSAAPALNLDQTVSQVVVGGVPRFALGVGGGFPYVVTGGASWAAGCQFVYQGQYNNYAYYAYYPTGDSSYDSYLWCDGTNWRINVGDSEFVTTNTVAQNQAPSNPYWISSGLNIADTYSCSYGGYGPATVAIGSSPWGIDGIGNATFATINGGPGGPMNPAAIDANISSDGDGNMSVATITINNLNKWDGYGPLKMCGIAIDGSGESVGYGYLVGSTGDFYFDAGLYCGTYGSGEAEIGYILSELNSAATDALITSGGYGLLNVGDIYALAFNSGANGLGQMLAPFGRTGYGSGAAEGALPYCSSGALESGCIQVDNNITTDESGHLSALGFNANNSTGGAVQLTNFGGYPAVILYAPDFSTNGTEYAFIAQTQSIGGQLACATGSNGFVISSISTGAVVASFNPNALTTTLTGDVYVGNFQSGATDIGGFLSTINSAATDTNISSDGNGDFTARAILAQTGNSYSGVWWGGSLPGDYGMIEFAQGLWGFCDFITGPGSEYKPILYSNDGSTGGWMGLICPNNTYPNQGVLAVHEGDGAYVNGQLTVADLYLGAFGGGLSEVGAFLATITSVATDPNLETDGNGNLSVNNLVLRYQGGLMWMNTTAGVVWADSNILPDGNGLLTFSGGGSGIKMDDGSNGIQMGSSCRLNMASGDTDTYVQLSAPPLNNENENTESMPASTVTVTVDETNNRLIFTVMYSDGTTVKTGTVALS